VKNIIIVLGEPNSINSEILSKSLSILKSSKKNFILVGNYNILKKQLNYLRLNLKIKLNFLNRIKINKNLFQKFNFIDIPLKQNKAFDLKSNNTNEYILQSFNEALNLLNNKKAIGIINLPVNKSKFTKKKFPGVTEFIAAKTNLKNKVNMLIFNKRFSVLPLTTHVPLAKVSKMISYNKILNACKNVSFFYKNTLKINKPRIGILGFNPHNGENGYTGIEEKKIIIPSINKLKKRFKIYGPLSPDTAFILQKKLKLNVLIGNYHDQVLQTYKYIFGFNAINITIGLPFIRISPDHGTAENLIGKNKSNPESFKEAIKFFSKNNVST